MLSDAYLIAYAQDLVLLMEARTQDSLELTANAALAEIDS